MEIPVIAGRQFATKFALRPQQFSWFLGERFVAEQLSSASDW